MEGNSRQDQDQDHASSSVSVVADDGETPKAVRTATSFAEEVGRFVKAVDVDVDGAVVALDLKISNPTLETTRTRMMKMKIWLLQPRWIFPCRQSRTWSTRWRIQNW